MDKIYYIQHKNLTEKELIIPNGYEEIKNIDIDKNYESCIEKIVLPRSVKKIHDGCFMQLNNLKTVELNEGLEYIGEAAFRLCYSLERIELPETLKVIENHAFSRTSLKEIDLKNVTHIGNKAFEYTKIKEIKINKNLTNIHNCSFYTCDIEKITVDERNPVYDSRNDCNALIRTETGALILGCKNTKIPDNITCINTEAFYNISFNTDIKISNNIKLLYNAFEICKFKNLDIRNLKNKDTSCMPLSQVTDTLITKDCIEIKNFANSNYPKNIFIDGSLDTFIKTNKNFYEECKEKCNFRSLSLEDLINQGLSFKEANKTIKRITNELENER